MRRETFRVVDVATAELVARFTMDVPAAWARDMAEFFVNESYWCAGNITDPEAGTLEVVDPAGWQRVLERQGTGCSRGCLCSVVRLETP